MEPGISIIIPAFNEAARIAQMITEAFPFANDTWGPETASQP